MFRTRSVGGKTDAGEAGTRRTRRTRSGEHIIMMPRPKHLNNTSALRTMRLHGGDSVCPDAGAAQGRRSARVGEVSVELDARSGEISLRLRPEPSAGGESLRGATMYLGERIK